MTHASEGPFLEYGGRQRHGSGEGPARLRKVRSNAMHPPTPKRGRAALALSTPIQTSGPRSVRLHTHPALPPKVWGHHHEVRMLCLQSRTLRLSCSAPVWDFPSFSLSCARPISPPHHTLPGTGPGGRVNQAPIAARQALPSPHQLRRCRHATQCWPTGTHRALGGRVCSLEQHPPACTTEPTQWSVSPGTAMQCHLQAEPR